MRLRVSPTGRINCVPPAASNGVSTLHFDLQPASQTLPPGGSASFRADASGFGLLSYQWLHSGTPLAGATNSSLVLPSIQAADQGTYQVVVTNGCGAITSAVATLTVTLPPRLGAAASLGAGGFEFVLEGQAGWNYAIEKSTNLVHWSVLSTLTLTNSAAIFLDPAAANRGAGFYRARQVP